MAITNPYEGFDPDKAQPSVVQPEPPAPPAGDRGEPTTRTPKKRRRGTAILIVLVIVFTLVAVGLFGLFFVRAMNKAKVDQAEAVKADPALEQRSSMGPDLGAYQEKVAQAMEAARQRQAAEEERARLAQKAAQAGGQADNISPPPGDSGTQPNNGPNLGKYQGQGGNGQAQSGPVNPGRKKKEDLTPEEIAALRRWDHDVMWDGKNATGGPGQQRNTAGSGAAGRAGQRDGRQLDNPSFDERMQANPFLVGANSSTSSRGSTLRGGSGGDSGTIGGLLATESYPDGVARVRPDLKFLLIHGTTIPCVLLPRIVTNYPGSTRCMINRDVYSADGSVVLISAGSVANGERKVAMQQGVAKVFVAWRDVETPDGATIYFDSMAGDQLGAAGLDAWVDNHYPERFGGAVVLSLLDDVFKALADQGRSSDGVTFDSSTNNAQDMASIALENSINIPPTGYVNQANELTILVARDVDFRSVYRVE